MLWYLEKSFGKENSTINVSITDEEALFCAYTCAVLNKLQSFGYLYHHTNVFRIIRDINSDPTIDHHHNHDDDNYNHTNNNNTNTNTNHSDQHITYNNTTTTDVVVEPNKLNSNNSENVNVYNDTKQDTDNYKDHHHDKDTQTPQKSKMEIITDDTKSNNNNIIRIETDIDKMDSIQDNIGNNANNESNENSENNDNSENKDNDDSNNCNASNMNEKKYRVDFWNFVDQQRYEIAIHRASKYRRKYSKYLASLPSEVLSQSVSLFSNGFILSHKICYKLITHCLLDTLLFDFYYDSASSHSIKKQERRLIDLNELNYGINLFLNMINNYPCIQFITTFCRELPHRYANNLFEQLKPYSLKRLKKRFKMGKQLQLNFMLNNNNYDYNDSDAAYLASLRQRPSDKYELSPQCKEILARMFDALAVVPDENIVFVDKDENENEEDDDDSDGISSTDVDNDNDNDNKENTKGEVEKIMMLEGMRSYILSCGAGYVCMTLHCC